jgi:hypothetical protein
MSIELKKFITNFLINKNDFKDLINSQIYLKQFRNKQLDNFSIKESRILYMSVLLYKFKNELDVGELFWKIVRTMILSILTNDTNMQENIKNYLEHFEVWKKNDINKLIFEIAAVYYNIIEIKKSIIQEQQNIVQSIEIPKSDKPIELSESLIYINQTLKNIEDQCEKINILNDVFICVQHINESTNEIIFNTMNRAYWDKLQNDINEKNYEIIIKNLEELKLNMKNALPKSEKNKSNYLLDECFDINFFNQMLNHNVFDKDNVKNLLNIIIMFLKDWDNAEANSIYDLEYNKLIDQINKSDYPKAFVIVLENGINLVSNFLLRKEAWSKLFGIE